MRGPVCAGSAAGFFGVRARPARSVVGSGRQFFVNCRVRGEGQRRIGFSICDSAAVRGAGAAADGMTGPVMGLGAAGCPDFG